MSRIVIDPDRRFLKVRFVAGWNVYKCLGIAIDQREPAALDLDHKPMTFPEAVIDLVEIDVEGFGFIWRKGFWFFEAVAETTAKYLHGNGQLKAAHRHTLSVDIRVNVDELDHEIGVRAGSAGDEMGGDRTCDGKIFRQGIGSETHDVRAAAYKALIFYLPGAPAAAGSIGRFDGTRTVRDRVGRIAGVGEGTLRAGWLGKVRATVGMGIQLAPFGVGGRPGFVCFPFV